MIFLEYLWWKRWGNQLEVMAKNKVEPVPQVLPRKFLQKWCCFLWF